jgi:D-galactarolactone isomerase
VQDYRLVQRRTGTSRVVIVTPRYYATDNRVTLDALQQLGASARGVAVANQTVTDAELKSLNDGGIRGIPFTLGDPATAVVRWEMVEPLAKRIADLDRHLQFNIDGELIVAGPNACAPRPCWPVLVGAGFRRISLPVLLTHRRRGSHNGLSSA